MDEWPQFRHDAALTSVSNDKVIGPCTGIRWIQGDLWTGGARRTVMILSAKGRTFYLYAPWHYEGTVDSIWHGYHIEARDAFNGLLLWQKGVGSSTELQRPMAVGGDRLYVHLAGGDLVAALDGATGATIRQYDVTGDITVSAGRLIVGAAPGTWVVVDTANGAHLRTIASGDTGEVPQKIRNFGASFNNAALLLGDSAMYTLSVKDGKKIIRKTAMASGNVLWETARQNGEVFHSVQRNTLFTLETPGDSKDSGNIRAYDAAKGTFLWTFPYTRKKASAGLFVAIFNRGDTVWTYDKLPFGENGRYVASADLAMKEPQSPGGINTEIGYVALDTRTGKRLTNDLGLWKDFGRCGPDLATNRYILGMDFNVYEPAKDGKSLSKIAGNFARGDCGISYAPANGLRYNSDNDCVCDMFIQGMIAVSSDSIPNLVDVWNKTPARLQKGPAYPFAGIGNTAEDWPMYRANPIRSAVSASVVAPTVAVKWRSSVGGVITPPVVAAGMVFVADVDAHTVHAVDAATGKSVWSYTAGGRIDSPPTHYRGALVFGARDGKVQALRAKDGKLIWEFMAAPVDRRIMVRGQLESVWPVYGTVLIAGNTAYAIAGRHGDADGGMFLYALNPLSGEEQWRQHLSAYGDIRTDPREADIFKVRSNKYPASSVRNDLMSSDGQVLFFSTLGVDIKTHAAVTRVKGRSLFTGQGTFLYDNTYPNPAAPGRFDWSVTGGDTGLSWRSNRGGTQVNPDACLLAFAGDTLYGIRQSQYLHQWKDWNDKREGYLFAASFSQKADSTIERVPFWAVKHRLFWTAVEKDKNPRFKALAVGKDRIVVTNQPNGGLLGGQNADVGEVLVFDKKGTLASRTDLGAEPLFDGVALAGGKVFVSTQKGAIVCLE
jgi:outer membrane protein assembly factor BamB